MIVKRDDLLSANVGEERVVMDVDCGVYISLDAVGARVWDLLDETQDLDALLDRITDEFDVSSETCRMEVTQFIDELVRHGAVSVTPS